MNIHKIMDEVLVEAVRKKETLYMTLRPLTIEIMTKNATGGKLPKK